MTVPKRLLLDTDIVIQLAIRKHPYGDEANDWEGVCIPSPIRAQESNFACYGRSFRPEGRGLNQQGKLIKKAQ
jgi:hypothetical protein